jgi:hypothetical protein
MFEALKRSNRSESQKVYYHVQAKSPQELLLQNGRLFYPGQGEVQDAIFNAVKARARISFKPTGDIQRDNEIFDDWLNDANSVLVWEVGS